MIVLLGGSGYVGAAVRRRLEAGGLPVASPDRRELDASSKDVVAGWFRSRRVDAVINAIGFTGRPNIDGTERERARTLSENVLVPAVLAEVLGDLKIPWGHVSSGCIFHGDGADGRGFGEEEEPAFAKSDPRAGVYARSKWMAETLLRDRAVWVWRLRIPFDEVDSARNYLTKLAQYDRLLEVRNSISHLGDFADAIIECVRRRVPFGTYNVTNPGSVLTSEVVRLLEQFGLRKKATVFFRDEDDFLAAPGRVFRASCVLRSEKLAAAGIHLRDVHEALTWSLANWKTS
ncbi:MAG: sugar nucleotide-binding protein [Terrimicrobiaceae bacterium]|nr:sugar nucleotide-binding protein [Terrimicrobiaceae bacterium]